MPRPDRDAIAVDPSVPGRRTVLRGATAGSLGITSLMLPSASSAASDVTPDGGATYAIGETGPGGGLIFLTPESSGGDGTHYYEAAPSDTSATLVEWIYNGSTVYVAVAVASATAIGDGPGNSAAMIAAAGAGTSAANLAATTTAAGGLSDWFLPSHDELLRMWTELGSTLGLTANASYWSSSQQSTNNAFILTNVNPANSSRSIQSLLKGGSARVRAVRRFAG